MAQPGLEVGDLPEVAEILDLPESGSRAEKTFDLLNRLLSNLESGKKTRFSINLDSISGINSPL